MGMADDYHEVAMETYMTDFYHKEISDTRRVVAETKREFGEPGRILYGEEAPKRKFMEPGRINYYENFKCHGKNVALK
jgi:hypothetical protein